MTSRIVPPTPASMAHAAQRLRHGGLVAFATETVYGLGADAGNPEAVRRIFAAKGRPSDHPVIVHLAHVDHVERWAREFPEGARRLAAAFWPGPLTLILPRAAQVDHAITGGQDSVGLRMPSHPVARQLLAAFAAAGGSGIAAPSANRFGHVSPTTAQHVEDDLGDAVTMILDGGACDVGIESTIVAFTGAAPMLLRPGGVGVDELVRVLGVAPRAPDANAPRASGTLASHYAPHAPAQLVAGDVLLQECVRRAASGEHFAVLARTIARPPGLPCTWVEAPADAARYAHDLYASLRCLDAPGVAAILIEDVPEDRGWLAVRDRLARATAHLDRPEERRWEVLPDSADAGDADSPPIPAIHAAAQQGYNAEAPAYARGRPEYPAQMLPWLIADLGVKSGTVAIDLGAGTGKFTTLLVAAGAQVVAVEPIAAMRTQLQDRLPMVEALAASAESIPLESASADVLVCAQAFHWFATEAALAEMHRVLAPGGRLGLVWNVRDESVDWVAAITEIITPFEGNAPRYYKGDWRRAFSGKYFSSLEPTLFTHHHVGTPQQVILDRFLSVSFIAALPVDAKAGVADQLRTLIATHPALRERETITFPYQTHAYRCFRLPDPTRSP